MFIVLSVAIGLIISAVEVFLMNPRQSVKNDLGRTLKNVFLICLFSFGTAKYVFRFEHFVTASGCKSGDYVIFTLICLVFGILLFLHDGLRQQYFFLEQEKIEKKRTGLKVFSIVLVFLGCACFFLTDWAKAEYGDLPADQIFITYFSPTTGSSMIDYTDVVEGPVFLSAFLTTIYGLLLCSDYKILYRKKGKYILVFGEAVRRIVCTILAAAVFISGLSYGICRFRVGSLYNAYLSRSKIIDDHYVDPRDAHIQFPEKKRNLIHIYLESVENSYMSRDLGGFMEQNLIPELTELAEEGYSFSHLDNQFGGPQSAVGTTWSVASMVNMSTGLPMKAPTEPNAYGSAGNFLPGACTLYDLLAEEGYEQTLMFGADADFGGLSYYFQSHGDVKIMDYKYAVEHKMIPHDYLVWWGFEDDKLFEFAKDEISRMSQTGKPFCFTMETADTHRPEGYLSVNAETPYPNQYANVVAYSSREVSKFVRWIQQQPFYENTTIVITGDHLSMETIFFDFYKFTDDFRRSQYNVILNPDPSAASREKSILFNRNYANFDFFPTILSSMGVTYDGNRLGIGTDLFSGEKTIFEEYGFEEANKELEKKSRLYNKQILENPNHS